MNKQELVKETLEQLLSSLKQWDGNDEKIAGILLDCQQQLTSLPQDTIDFTGNEALVQSVIQEYQSLLEQLKISKEAIAQEMIRLNQTDLSRAYQLPISSGYEFYY